MNNPLVLDTNLYISFFVRRDEAQFLESTKLINQLDNEQISIFLPSLIVGEIFYILTKLYSFEKSKVCESLQSLTNLPNLITENKEVLMLAIENYSTKNLDFADCYLLAIQEIKNFNLITFDKKLKNQL